MPIVGFNANQPKPPTPDFTGQYKNHTGEVVTVNYYLAIDQDPEEASCEGCFLTPNTPEPPFYISVDDEAGDEVGFCARCVREHMAWYATNPTVGMP